MSNKICLDNEALYPSRRIVYLADMQRFKTSPARAALLEYIEGVSASLARAEKNENVSSNLNMALDQLDCFLREIEAQVVTFQQTDTNTPARFGDPSFRLWLEYAKMRSSVLIEEVLPNETMDVREELKEYLQSSFGNSVRLDYGTEILGVFRVEERVSVVLRAFDRYISTTRAIQVHFRLEPAGSCGVWGIDDYCFLPFLWGAAQLIHSATNPQAISSDNVYPDDGLFFKSCSYLRQAKGGPLRLVSPVLASLSNVPTWSKVAEGLLKMYCGECLDKFQIMQHFRFGLLLRLD